MNDSVCVLTRRHRRVTQMGEDLVIVLGCVLEYVCGDHHLKALL